MAAGTINVARSLWDDPAFQNEPFSEREAWIWLIAEASWKPRERRIGKVTLTVSRGQVAHSTRFLADTWRWTHSKVRRFLERLENRHMIRRETDTGVSLICVMKYDTYQNVAQPSDTAPAQQRHSSGTNENKGEIRGKEGIDILGAYAPDADTQSQPEKPKRQPKRRPECELPEGWVPNDRNIQDAQKKGLTDAQIDREAEQFRNWHGSKQSRYRDWDAAWRTWIGNAVTRGTRSGRHINSANATMDAIAIAARARPTPIPDRW